MRLQIRKSECDFYENLNKMEMTVHVGGADAESIVITKSLDSERDFFQIQFYSKQNLLFSEKMNCFT